MTQVALVESTQKWTAYTPTLVGFGTATVLVASYRRNGSSIEVQFKFNSGTSTAVIASVSLPSGLSAGALLTARQAVGAYNNSNQVSATGTIMAIAAATSITFASFGNSNTSEIGSGLVVNTQNVNGSFSMAIAEWA